MRRAAAISCQKAHDKFPSFHLPISSAKICTAPHSRASSFTIQQHGNRQVKRSTGPAQRGDLEEEAGYRGDQPFFLSESMMGTGGVRAKGGYWRLPRGLPRE